MPNSGVISKGKADALVKRFGSPLYVYDESVIQKQCRMLTKHFPNTAFHYACKANSNPNIVRIIKKEGLNIETVSPGEILLAQKVGFTAERISFTCSNLTEKELRFAAKSGARVHLDSLTQLSLWGKNKLGTQVSLRLNQGIGAGHHKHVITGGPESKFGIGLEDIPEALTIAEKFGLKITGLQQHIGSNVLDADILLTAARHLFMTAEEFPDITHLDFGGGFGVSYRPDQRSLDIERFARDFKELRNSFEDAWGKKVEVSFEPGRFIVAEAGTLLATVVDKKTTSEHTFVGIDSGFNHLIRPAMYDSYHEILNTSKAKGRIEIVSIAGNICESGDLFATHREMVAPKIGDILALRNAGAYGMSMASMYNLRAVPREVLVSKASVKDISFSPHDYAKRV